MPAASGRRAISSAATTAAPDEMPDNRPSSVASRRAISIACSLETFTTSSISDVSRISGMKPAPMPWILCLPGLPPEMTGLSAGSIAIALKLGFLAFSTWATPVSVPPVPTPEIR